MLRQDSDWRFGNMRKIYNTPEINVVRFSSVDSTNLINLSIGGTEAIGTTGNLKGVNIASLHK